MPCLTFKWPSFYCVCTLCIFSLYNIQNLIVTWKAVFCAKKKKPPKPQTQFSGKQENF